MENIKHILILIAILYCKIFEKITCKSYIFGYKVVKNIHRIRDCMDIMNGDIWFVILELEKKIKNKESK